MTVSEINAVEERLSTTLVADANAHCAYCGWRSGLVELQVARTLAREHALTCATNPLQQRIAALEAELRQWKGWAAERLLGTGD